MSASSGYRYFSRRQIIGRGLAMAAVLLSGSLGVVTRLMAAGRPDAAFAQKHMSAAVSDLFGDLPVEKSERITINMHDLAENGAVVPITILTDLEAVEAVAILAQENPIPLVALYEFDASLQGYLATRIKLADSTDVMVCVKAGGKVYQTSRFVEVTVGGCSA